MQCYLLTHSRTTVWSSLLIHPRPIAPCNLQTHLCKTAPFKLFSTLQLFCSLSKMTPTSTKFIIVPNQMINHPQQPFLESLCPTANSQISLQPKSNPSIMGQSQASSPSSSSYANDSPSATLGQVPPTTQWSIFLTTLLTLILIQSFLTFPFTGPLPSVCKYTSLEHLHVLPNYSFGTN